MYVSYQWLKEWVSLDDITPEELGEKMSRTGIEIEEVKELSAGLKKIVVGEVKECIDHPNSDHLHICQVDTGEEVTQIVCGAPNVAAGQKVIVALPGARIVDNIKIKKGKMRGEVSNGMLCALEEINIPQAVTPKEYADGIYILPEDAVNGDSVFPYLGMEDAILELAITPNRADALSMYGVAYEVGAIYNKEVTVPSFTGQEAGPKTALEVKATVKETKAVSDFYLRKVKGVTVAPSPRWLQNRLMHMGIRPMNNVVDAVNYMMLTFGEPMHAYDASKVGNMDVSFAKEGESFQALNEEEYTLTAEDLVIRDEHQILSLAGVMGGESSAVQDTTTDVILEAGIFAPSMIRKTSQRHHLRTESSQRFEKGVNAAMPKQAIDALAFFIQELAGGEVCEGRLDVVETEVKPEEITITTDRINHVLGTILSTEEVVEIFGALQFPTEVMAEEIHVHVPARRFDIHIEADLIEEVARIYGYDRLPSTLPSGAVESGQLTPKQKMIRQFRHQLEGQGCQEVISYALLTEDEANRYALAEGKNVALDFPMSQEHAFLRQSLVTGLLNDLQFNMARQNKDLAFYEVGTVFEQGADRLPIERTHLAFALTGKQTPDTWQEKGKEVDFFYAKGLVEGILAYLNPVETVQYVASQREGMHPGRCADIVIGDIIIGYVGEIHPTEAKRRDLSRVYVAELDVDALNDIAKAGIQFAEVSKFPTVTRDIAILVDRTVTNGEIEALIQEKGGKWLRSVTLFDVYMGENIAEDKKSMAYQCAFNKQDATLTDEEIEQAMNKIIAALEETYQAVIR